ncbi:MAG: RNA degradosome polyphosphate kinase [Lachnospiraceae bacterium]|nr:RNA degradosome polyphosphate kinase [Lachnospiraceae bacterium]
MKSPYNKPEYYDNRELSWLEFNNRVLSEAYDTSLPLFERLKFLSITSSNLDEFVMIRVASLKDMVHADYEKPDIAGMTPKMQLAEISAKAHALVESQYNIYNSSFLHLLKDNNIVLVTHYEDLTDKQRTFVNRYFTREVYPVLTPMAVDSSRPFPLIRNKSLNIAALLKSNKTDETYEYATVQVPSVLPRLIRIPSDDSDAITLIFLEQIIEMNMDKLFLGYNIISACPYRIMRNADLTIEEDEAADLLTEIERQVKKRQWGEIIKLEVEKGIDERLLTWLRDDFNIKKEDLYIINGPLDLTFFMKLYGIDGFSHLKNKPYTPQPVPGLDHDEDIFAQIRNKDILLFHPFYTFDPVVEFVRKAASDPNVLAIKQTLYRVSSNSPIISSLALAAENGKQVSVLVELKARFDEENNIIWARKLEQAGCHVIYGLVGLKTHSKITLVVRREKDGIRRYVHLGTGNYNDSTAKQYTDMGLFTCSQPIGEDATAVFNMLSGYSEPASWNKLSLAPLWLRDKFMECIMRETEHARNGKKAHMIVKINSLCDAKIIAALYEASAAGVKIELIIRGICSLKVGIAGISDNITVHSIVGNYLEHSRIFYFYNDGNEDIYMGSADWMPRNLDKRVEILFPVDDVEIKERIKHILDIQLRDNVKTRIKLADSSYKQLTPEGDEPINSQDYFCREAIEQTRHAKKEKNSPRVFEPMKNPL